MQTGEYAAKECQQQQWPFLRSFDVCVHAPNMTGTTAPWRVQGLNSLNHPAFTGLTPPIFIPLPVALPSGPRFPSPTSRTGTRP